MPSRLGPERRLWHRPRDGTRLAGPSAVGVATYQPRAAEGTVLHRVVRENLEKFRELAGRLIRVPKAEAEEQAKRYREERAQRKK